MGIRVLGTGSYTPAFQVTNEDMAKIVETNDEWIRTRTGIGTRHISDGEPTWYMGAEAAKRAIAAAGIDPLEIGLLIDTTITPEYCTPSMSCIIQRDGAAAAVIEYKEDALYTSHLGADGTGAKFLYAHSALPQSPFVKPERQAEYDDGIGAGPEGWEHTMLQDGREVYKFATHALAKAATMAAEKIGFDLNELDKIVPHQANIRIIETAMKFLKQPMEKVITNIEYHGNTSSASIPIAFDEAIRAGKIQRGDKVCLVGFGAGLTYAALIMEY